MPPQTKPSDEIIEDDIELDRWFENYTRQAARAAGGHRKAGISQDHIPEFTPDA